MPLFRRMTDIVSANLNDLVDRFECPEKMLRQAVREMEQAVGKALDRAVSAVAHEKLLARRLTEHRAQIERRQRQAAEAIQSGNEAQARAAITRRLQQEKMVESLETQHSAAAALSRRLRKQIERLRAKLGETRRTLATLSARKSVTEAQKALFIAASGTSGGETLSNVDHWVGRLEQAEAEAEAWCEVAGGLEEDVAPEDDGAVDRELARLKESARV